MTTDPKTDRIGNDFREGPNPAPGGDVDLTDREVPPYDGRTSGDDNSDASRGTIERQMAQTDRGNPGATASPAVESKVRPDEVTDREPDAPHGVGESTTTRGEDQAARSGKEPGRDDTGRTGADRPTGVSTPRDGTGV